MCQAYTLFICQSQQPDICLVHMPDMCLDYICQSVVAGLWAACRPSRPYPTGYPARPNSLSSGGRPVQTSCTPCRLCRLFKPFKTTENKTLEFRSREVGGVIRPIKLIGIRKEPVQHGEKGGIFNV
jgi:hypothetical protein